MDQQNPNSAPKPVPTAEEIARLEAEAVAALQRGKVPGQGEAPQKPQAPASAEPAEPTPPGFVPYVDDVAEEPAPAPAPKAEPESADNAPEDEDDEPYVPGPWEERVDALTPKQWKLVQIVGGALLGLIAIALLFIGGEELATYRMIVAALVALLVPRYVERVLRRPLNLARRAMIVAMLVGLVAAFLVIGARNGFDFTKAG